jgi:hypothetical protein
MTRLHAVLLRRLEAHHRWADEKALRRAVNAAPTEESAHELMSLAAHRG